MLETFPAAAIFALVVALALAVLYALTVVPVVLAIAMAERRGFPTARWTAAAIAGVLIGLALAVVLRRAGGHIGVQGAGLLLVFTAPMALWLLERGDRLGGRGGRHESPV